GERVLGADEPTGDAIDARRLPHRLFLVPAHALAVPPEGVAVVDGPELDDEVLPRPLARERDRALVPDDAVEVGEAVLLEARGHGGEGPGELVVRDRRGREPAGDLVLLVERAPPGGDARLLFPGRGRGIALPGAQALELGLEVHEARQ